MTESAPQGRLARTVEAVLTLFATVVFVVLWIYVALAALTDSTLPADTWAWLSGLGLLPAIVAWVAILPLGVFLWAAQAELDTLWMGIIMLGLVGWTWMALAGLWRMGRRRARAGSAQDAGRSAG